MLAKSKLDSIETLVSQALIDMEISHEEFNAIVREKKKRWKKIWGMSVNAAPLKNKKIWDWIVWIKKKWRVCEWFLWLVKRFASLKKNYFFVCTYKMNTFSLFTAEA